MRQTTKDPPKMADGCLFCTTQDTIFFIFVVDSFAGVAALCTEIEVAMEVENEHLAEVAHLGVLRVRRKGREIFGSFGASGSYVGIPSSVIVEFPCQSGLWHPTLRKKETYK